MPRAAAKKVESKVESSAAKPKAVSKAAVVSKAKETKAPAIKSKKIVEEEEDEIVEEEEEEAEEEEAEDEEEADESEEEVVEDKKTKKDKKDKKEDKKAIKIVEPESEPEAIPVKAKHDKKKHVEETPEPEPVPEPVPVKAKHDKKKHVEETSDPVKKITTKSKLIAEEVGKVEKVEKVDKVEKVEKAEKVEKVDKPEKSEKSEKQSKPSRVKVSIPVDDEAADEEIAEIPEEKQTSGKVYRRDTNVPKNPQSVLGFSYEDALKVYGEQVLNKTDTESILKYMIGLTHQSGQRAVCNVLKMTLTGLKGETNFPSTIEASSYRKFKHNDRYERPQTADDRPRDERPRDERPRDDRPRYDRARSTGSRPRYDASQGQGQGQGQGQAQTQPQAQTGQQFESRPEYRPQMPNRFQGMPGGPAIRPRFQGPGGSGGPGGPGTQQAASNTDA
jgi:hypothetical protein